MKYNNVLCVYPYRQELKTVGFLPPIGIEYIASAVEGLVNTIDVIDLRHEKRPLSSFINKDTDLVLVSHNWDMEEEFVKRTINSIPEDITVIVGGRHATSHVEELFESIPRIDGIVRGDGEEIAREIVQRGISSDIDGLSFRSNGNIIHNKNRRLEPIRSDLYPNRSRRRYKYMMTFDEFNSGIQIDMMSGSRGCPFNCKFCDFSYNPLGEKRRWTYRTPESIVEEITKIEAGIIGFSDDAFTVDLDWVERICDLIIKEKIKKKFVINTRVDVARRPDILKKMYKAGFALFLMGIESAHDKTLASMNKGFTIERLREYFDVLRRFNFIYHCYFIIGNIGETRQEMFDIVKLSHELGADTLGLSVLRATKYSPLKDLVKGLGNYHVEEATGKVYSDMLSSEELQQIRRDVNASFFTIPVILRLLKKAVIHRLLTIGRVYKIVRYIARRKMQKNARRKAIRMRNIAVVR